MEFEHRGDRLKVGARRRKRMVDVWIIDQTTRLMMMSDEYELEKGDDGSDLTKYRQRAMEYYRGVNA